MAASTSCLSLVGACTRKALSLKETTPMRTPSGCRSTNVRAASLAASRRLGVMSSARMLPETSMVRMTVPSWEGSVTTDRGRARAKSRTVRPTRNKRRRHVPPPAGAAPHRLFDQGQAGKAQGIALAAALQPEISQHQAAAPAATTRAFYGHSNSMSVPLYFPSRPADGSHINTGIYMDIQDVQDRTSILRILESHVHSVYIMTPRARRRCLRRAANVTRARTRSSSVESDRVSTRAWRKAVSSSALCRWAASR